MSMTDEEKKAIEIVQGLKVYYDNECLLDEEELEENKTVNNAIDMVLNLVEKQQNEIKDLKEKNEILTNITYLYNSYEVNNENKIIVADKEYFDSGLFVKRYISKDKIKEKIKEIENYTYMSNEEMKQQDYAIVKLEELLEE